MKRGLFALRVSGCVLCLISFSVLAADKSQGWVLDSFYRYKEFGYCLTVNVVGFLYSGFQAIDLAMLPATGKRMVKFHLRHYTEFFMDQVMSYLLLSSSSSVAARVDDWESNGGRISSLRWQAHPWASRTWLSCRLLSAPSSLVTHTVLSSTPDLVPLHFPLPLLYPKDVY